MQTDIKCLFRKESPTVWRSKSSALSGKNLDLAAVIGDHGVCRSRVPDDKQAPGVIDRQRSNRDRPLRYIRTVANRHRRHETASSLSGSQRYQKPESHNVLGETIFSSDS